VNTPPPPSEDVRRWRHSLRNELNVITMATSTAVSLIHHGESIERVREHLERAEAACRRCHALVKEWPDGG
jgi:intracellular sulfur oxidation DsrE/DsrF family protein